MLSDSSLPTNVVEALPSPVFVTQRDRLRYVNTAARTRFQFNGHPIDTYTIWDLIYVEDDARLRAHIDDAEDTPAPITVTMCPFHGTPYMARLTFANIGEDTLLITVTDLKHLEDPTPINLPVDLDALRSFMMTTISHEFRTPLSIILSATELIDRYHERISPEKRTEQLQKIKRQVLHLNEIINDIALIAGADHGRLDEQGDRFDMVRLCHDVVRRIEVGCGVEHQVMLKTPMHACKMKGDQTKLARVLIDLMENAVKFSAPGSTVQLILEYRDDSLIIQVIDEGMGIPKEIKPMIFKPFYRAPEVIDTNGTGLGMAIVRIYTEMHGGTVDVASTVGEGTTVTLTFPT